MELEASEGGGPGSTSPLAALFIRPCSMARFGERRLGSPVRGALGEAGMSLPVKVWSVQSEQAGRERALRASR